MNTNNFRYGADFIGHFIRHAVQNGNGDRFWRLWTIFADQVFDVTHLHEKSLSYKDGQLIEALMLVGVFNYSTQIRSNSRLHQGVLSLLDILIAYGSSVAFQLRERIVKPSKQKGRAS